MVKLIKSIQRSRSWVGSPGATSRAVCNWKSEVDEEARSAPGSCSQDDSAAWLTLYCPQCWRGWTGLFMALVLIHNLFLWRFCPLISESPNLTRYCSYGMKKTKRYAWQWTSHSKVLFHFPGTNIQHPLFPHQLPLILHLWQVKCRSLWLASQALLLPGISLSGSLIEDILGLRPGGAAR